MTKRMLIDASHPEETRVVVVSGNRVEEFDYEIASKKPLKGNIYLAKITRVEPSLQAAFVDYGGGRHGFLPFSEIHPDYYRIPIADREALIAEEEDLRAAEGESPGENGDDVPESALDRADQHEREEEIAAQIAAEEGDDSGNGEEVATEVEELESETSVDTVGGDEIEEALRRRAKLMRKYKIQEVIKRRQVLLVQVTKEERGTKGAALTTYLSLAGRYCVLMPNTGKGGGISRKIANAPDRRRLKEVLAELEIPQGMAVIVRTAGSQRTKAEIRRDYEYLLRLWDEIRTTTLESTAPKLIHEEANLIKRAIRDQYTRDMNEVLVEGDEGHKSAKAFMKMLMPSHARHVKLYKDEAIPLMHKYQVESQLEAMYSTQIRLKSGGSIVINPTEALVAIDVNSGKATKERHIEETALKTNIEAAEEVGRQLRLRDLAGLIVIDFIDMEESRHNRDVERKLKEALKSDRARIQLGRISPFGLLELSRQRLRPSLFETSNEACPTCGGTGFVRSKESSCLQLLRAVTEEAIKDSAENISVRLPTELALYLLNEHRARIAEIEERYGLSLLVKVDDELGPSEFAVARINAEGKVFEATRSDSRDKPAQQARQEDSGDDKQRKRSRRGGRRRKKDDDRKDDARAEESEDTQEEAASEEKQEAAPPSPESDDQEEKKGSRRRRRGKRGGRRRSKRKEGEDDAQQAQDGQQGDSQDHDQDRNQDRGQSDDGQNEISADQTDDAQAGQDAGEPSADAAESKPRKRRSSRKKAAAAKAGDDSVTESGEQPAAAEGDAEQPAVEEKPKRRRSRKPKAKKDESAKDESAKDVAQEAAAAEDGAKEAPATEKPELKERPKAEESPKAEPSRSKAPANEDSGPTPSGGETSNADDGEDEESESQPKRRGWWNRALG